MLKPGKIVSDEMGITNIRVLSKEDLAVLRERRDEQAPLITRLKDPHHRLARLLAAGLPDTEAGPLSGYSLGRISQLRADPTFRSLVESYRQKVTQAYIEQVDHLQELAISNMVKAERMIAEKLDAADEDGESVPVRILDTLAQGRMDRFGYGKKQTNLNVNVDFASQLERAIKRSGKESVVGTTPSSPRLVDGRPLPGPPTTPSNEPVHPLPLRRRA